MKASVMVLGIVGSALVSTVALAAGGAPSPGVVQGWDGVAYRPLGVRYVALDNRGFTTVAAVRLRGGRVIRYRSLSGSFGVPAVAFDGTTGGLTPDGGKLVLAGFPRRVTRFVMLDTQTFKVQTRIALTGNYAFDAVSPDGRTLYLTQYLRGGPNYRIRAFDVRTGRLVRKPVIAKGDDAAMRGEPVARRMGARGRWAFTLYTGGKEPFVHALDTVKRRAVCLDLPRKGAKLELWGRRLLVLTRSGARVATIDTRTMRVV
jgi:hypothetical protein